MRIFHGTSLFPFSYVGWFVWIREIGIFGKMAIKGEVSGVDETGNDLVVKYRIAVDVWQTDV